MNLAVAGGTGTVGRYVVEEGRAAGHQLTVLSRSTGFDLSDDGVGPALRRALEGVDALIDTTDPHTIARKSATVFFEGVTRRLQAVGSASGVLRLVTLSIVGIDRVPGWGYYLAKQHQEQVAARGPDSGDRGPRHPVPRIPGPGPDDDPLRPSGTHDEDAHPADRGTDGRATSRRSGGRSLRGRGNDTPDRGSDDLRAGGSGAPIPCATRSPSSSSSPCNSPGQQGARSRGGAVLPTPGVPTVGPTFDQWLDSEDALSLAA